jgi:hypothetical protein
MRAKIPLRASAENMTAFFSTTDHTVSIKTAWGNVNFIKIKNGRSIDPDQPSVIEREEFMSCRHDSSGTQLFAGTFEKTTFAFVCDSPLSETDSIFNRDRLDRALPSKARRMPVLRGPSSLKTERFHEGTRALAPPGA